MPILEHIPSSSIDNKVVVPDQEEENLGVIL